MKPKKELINGNTPKFLPTWLAKATHVVFAVVFSLLLQAPSAFAQEGVHVHANLTLPCDGQGHCNVPAQLDIRVVDGAAASEAFLEHLPQNSSPRDMQTIVITDADVAQLPQENQQNSTRHMNSGAGTERVQSLVMATVLSSIKSASIIFLSRMPHDPAVASVVVSTLVTFYLNWDVERWGKFLYRGQELATRAAKSIGLKTVADHPFFKEVAKHITGYVGTSAFATLYIGLSMWDHFKPELANDPMGVFGHILVSSLKATLVAQPFDVVFARWLRSENAPLTPAKTRRVMRLKSLFMTALTPLIYANFAPATTVSKGVMVAGITLMLLDYSLPSVKDKVRLSWKAIKNSVSGWLGKNVPAQTCPELLSVKDAS